MGLGRDFRILPWDGLDAVARGTWRSLRASAPAGDGFDSPFFDPAFLDAVHAVRGDLEIVVVLDPQGAPRGFLPFHRDGLGGLIPAAGPLSDWNGLLTDLDHLDPLALLDAAGAHALHFTAAPATTAAVLGRGARADLSRIIDLADGPEVWLDTQGRAAPKAFRNLRARRRRAEAEYGAVRVVADDRSTAAFAALFAWKSDQYRRTRQFDVFAPAWTRALVEALFACREPGLCGRLSTLWLGDRLAAAHFGIQGGDLLHYWFPAYDEACAAVSPGLLLLLGLIEQAPSLGIGRIELGGGDYQFKKDLANAGRPAGPVIICRPTAVGAARAAVFGDGRLSGSTLPELPVRAIKRAYRAWTFLRAPSSGTTG